MKTFKYLLSLSLVAIFFFACSSDFHQIPTEKDVVKIDQNVSPIDNPILDPSVMERPDKEIIVVGPDWGSCYTVAAGPDFNCDEDDSNAPNWLTLHTTVTSSSLCWQMVHEHEQYIQQHFGDNTCLGIPDYACVAYPGPCFF